MPRSHADTHAYRKDNRTDAEFARDIKIGNEIERQIMKLFCEHITRWTGMVPKVEENGVGMNGEALHASKINTEADFILNGKPTEVKFINPKSTEFRFKVSQINSYIRQKAWVLLVNGWDTPHPHFTLISPAQLMSIRDELEPREFALWGHKLCYFLEARKFTWTPLKA